MPVLIHLLRRLDLGFAPTTTTANGSPSMANRWARATRRHARSMINPDSGAAAILTGIPGGVHHETAA
jgi:hypothetical protein